MMQTQTVRARVPRYIRRLIHDTSQCHYQREEYATVAERNDRYTLLKSKGTPGLVRYSDSGAIGLVYVVAWPRPHGPLMIDKGTDRGMTPADRKATPHSDGAMSGNSPKFDTETISMEMSVTATGKISESDVESVSMETETKT